MTKLNLHKAAKSNLQNWNNRELQNIFLNKFGLIVIEKNEMSTIITLIAAENLEFLFEGRIVGRSE